MFKADAIQGVVLLFLLLITFSALDLRKNLHNDIEINLAECANEIRLLFLNDTVSCGEQGEDGDYNGREDRAYNEHQKLQNAQFSLQHSLAKDRNNEFNLKAAMLVVLQKENSLCSCA